MYRTLDLLISALNNIRREMSFFEITATKYGIQLSDDPPSHITRAYIDLFNSVSSPGASLLEGMVVLWATEHVSHTSLSVQHDTNPHTVLPYSLAIRRLFHLHPFWPKRILRQPHRRPSPVPHPQLDISRLLQIRRRLPRPSRRARQLFNHA